jgi:hypothetical protein
MAYIIIKRRGFIGIWFPHPLLKGFFPGSAQSGPGILDMMILENTDQGKIHTSSRQLNATNEEKWVKAEVERRFLMLFNDLVDAKGNVFFLNEGVIEELIEDLEDHVSIRNDGYWLTLARINELALLCAENYANNCEFSLVGDLLINPRLILVHVSGLNQPVVKKRHIPLSVQFRNVGSNSPEIRNWLKTKTLVEVKTEALLPELFKKLQSSGRFDREYLTVVEQRKRSIADLTGFLASGGITDIVSLRMWMENATPADRRLMESRFCPLDFGWFFKLGRKVTEWGNAWPALPFPEMELLQMPRDPFSMSLFDEVHSYGSAHKPWNDH